MSTFRCPGCNETFHREGKETLCETCEQAEAFGRECCECGRDFTSGDMFADICPSCNRRNHALDRNEQP